MLTRHRSGAPSRPDLHFILLAILLSVLWLAGGASRADALGQVIVRSTAWTALVVAVAFADQPSFGRSKPVFVILLAVAALVLLQLAPLPPAIWQALPGRAPFIEAAAASGQPQPWRPLSLAPGATLNAAASLVTPFAVLLFVAGLTDRGRARLPGLLLGLIAASTIVGLLQFSAGGLNNPFVNDTAGQVSGTFANRNHFALFLALGCLIAPVWAFMDGRRPGWRGPVAFGLLLLFALTILASGSRAGTVAGGLALGIGLLLARRGLRRELRRAPRWAFPAAVAGLVGTVAIFVLLSIAVDRAESIDRAVAIDPGQDMRARGLPTVLGMIRTYFPAGSGFGGFDPVFRMHEPFDLLKPTYFNHAHDDFLEVVLDGGLPALVLLIAAAGWWAFASIRAWRAGSGPEHALPQLGSSMLLLILLASIVDYPARTPMIMAMTVIAGVWLSGRADGSVKPLPETDRHL